MSSFEYPEFETAPSSETIPPELWGLDTYDLSPLENLTMDAYDVLYADALPEINNPVFKKNLSLPSSINGQPGQAHIAHKRWPDSSTTVTILFEPVVSANMPTFSEEFIWAVDHQTGLVIERPFILGKDGIKVRYLTPTKYTLSPARIERAAQVIAGVRKTNDG